MKARMPHLDFPIVSAALAAAALFLTPAARAQLLAYESFNYSPVGSFAVGGTPTTATGFSGNVLWDFGTSTASLLQSGSQSYSDGSSTLSTANNHYENGHGRLVMNLDVSGGGPFASYLESGRIGANGTTLFVSFLYRNIATSASGYSGFEFFRGTNTDPNRILSTNAWSGHSSTNFHLTVGEGANGGIWGGGAESAINDNLGFINASVNFFVIRFDFGSGTDTATIYANPSLSGLGSATGQVTDDDLSFDRIGNSTFTGGAALLVDEIRVGSTYAGVAAIPEPGSAALCAGLAALAVIALRRRRLAGN
jgi:hypothetical protein